MIVRPILIVAAALMLASATGQGALVLVDAPIRVAVRFDPGTTVADRADALATVDATASRSVPGVPGVRVVTLPGGASATRASARLQRDDAVRWADPVGTSRIMATPNDPLFDQVWGLAGPGADINVLAAWNVTTGNRDVPIAVADTGVAPDHPDLTGNLLTAKARNFVAGANDMVNPAAWADLNGHGTHVAGTIGAVGNNGLGVAGVNWQAGIVPVRVMDLGGSGDNVEVASGAAYAAEHARVVNMSLGGSGPNRVLGEAIAAHPNTLFVVAAGNSSENVDVTPLYPCAFGYANLICVASLTQAGGLSLFSSYGLTTVDLGAPGSARTSAASSACALRKWSAPCTITSSPPPIEASQSASAAGGVRWSFSWCTMAMGRQSRCAQGSRLFEHHDVEHRGHGLLGRLDRLGRDHLLDFPAALNAHDLPLHQHISQAISQRAVHLERVQFQGDLGVEGDEQGAPAVGMLVVKEHGDLALE